MIASLLKCVSDLKILIFPVWNKILKIWDTLFELILIEVECSKNYFNFFLPQEDGASGNNIVKEPPKPHPTFKKTSSKFLQRIFTLPAILCNW